MLRLQMKSRLFYAHLLNDSAYRFVFFQASNDQRKSGALRRFDGFSLNQIAPAIRKLQGSFERELLDGARIGVPVWIAGEIPGNVFNQFTSAGLQSRREQDGSQIRAASP